MKAWQIFILFAAVGVSAVGAGAAMTNLNHAGQVMRAINSTDQAIAVAKKWEVIANDWKSIAASNQRRVHAWESVAQSWRGVAEKLAKQDGFVLPADVGRLTDEMSAAERKADEWMTK